MWHRRLVYTESNTICSIVSDRSVNQLNVLVQLDIEELCEDCIFNIYLLKNVYFHIFSVSKRVCHVFANLWGSALVQLVGGTHYFIILTDGFLSYCTVAFLNGKLTDIILKVFKTYHAKAEWKIDWKLRKVHLYMERE